MAPDNHLSKYYTDGRGNDAHWSGNDEIRQSIEGDLAAAAAATAAGDPHAANQLHELAQLTQSYLDETTATNN